MSTLIELADLIADLTAATTNVEICNGYVGYSSRARLESIRNRAQAIVKSLVHPSGIEPASDGVKAQPGCQQPSGEQYELQREKSQQAKGYANLVHSQVTSTLMTTEEVARETILNNAYVQGWGDSNRWRVSQLPKPECAHVLKITVCARPAGMQWSYITESSCCKCNKTFVIDSVYVKHSGLSDSFPT